MVDEHDLRAMLQGYVDGDVLARKVIVDLLEEMGDPRAATMREEQIDWDRLAYRLANDTPPKRIWALSGEPGRMRFRIECARFGSPTTPDVVEAVREARRKWVRSLFPELEF